MVCCYHNGRAKARANISQKWLIFILFVWLFFSIARQTFDLIGKLWIPVAFNLLQLLSCISGLFAAFQCRFGLLIGLSISTFFSIGYNIALFFWYNGFFGIELRDSNALSAGLPYGHSFFLRHTPFCKGAAYFNLSIARWEQHNSKCFLSYHEVEGLQASMHIALALITLILSVWTLIKRQKILTVKRQKFNKNLLSTLSYNIKGGTVKPKKVFNALGTFKKARHSQNSVVIPSMTTNSLKNLRMLKKIIANGVEFTTLVTADDVSKDNKNSSYASGAIGSVDLNFQQNPTFLPQSSFKVNSTLQQSVNFCRQNLKNKSLTDLPEKVYNIQNPDEYSSATTSEINATQHSTFNSTSSAFNKTNQTNFLDAPLPPPPFPALTLRAKLGSSEKYSVDMNVNINNNSVNINTDDNNIFNNSCDSDNDSTAYSQIEQNMEFRPQSLDSTERQDKNDKRLQNNGKKSNGTYGLVRLFASRSNGKSNRYNNAKSKGQIALSSSHIVGVRHDVQLSPQADSCSHYVKPKHNALLLTLKDVSQHANSKINVDVKHLRTAINSVSTANELLSAESTGYVEFLNRNPAINNRSSLTNLTSLISFDPKSNTLIRVREHQNSESEESTIVSNSLTDGLLVKNASPLVSLSTAQPIRQKMIPPRCGNNTLNYMLKNNETASPTSTLNYEQLDSLEKKNVNIKSATNFNQISQNELGIQSSNTLFDHKHLLSIIQRQSEQIVFNTQHNVNYCSNQGENNYFQSQLKNENFVNGNNGNVNCYQPNDADFGIKMAPSIFPTKKSGLDLSIYDCIEGQRPLSFTSFPVSSYCRQRAVAGISVASAITLTSNVNNSDLPQNYYSSTSFSQPELNNKICEIVSNIKQSTTFNSQPSNNQCNSYLQMKSSNILPSHYLNSQKPN